MPTQMTLPLFIEPERAGTYFTLPFTMPPNTEAMTLTYHYERHRGQATSAGAGQFTSRQEVNIIDLGLVAPSGAQVGATGSDKSTVFVSETQATPGCRPTPLIPGEWQIIVGAYKIVPEGVNVTYELTFAEKQPRWLKGDLHAHTMASDGVLTAEELGWRALRHGLDFLAITDHNQTLSADAMPKIPGLTMIPGMEWTHFKGHANFLGVEKPYDVPFFANTQEEVQARFDSAHQRGALITLNHPFDPGVAFQFDFTHLPIDCLEIWNGPMREGNFKAIGYWQGQLQAGKKLPVCGGSDYHHDTPFLFPGGPTTHVYAQSAGMSDILVALRQGHAFINFSPEGPTLEFTAGDAILGDTVSWSQAQEMHITADRLNSGDVVRVVTANASTPILEAPSAGRFEATYPMDAPGFARVEILRAFLPGLPLLPALISNPIYFDR